MMWLLFQQLPIEDDILISGTTPLAVDFSIKERAESTEPGTEEGLSLV